MIRLDAIVILLSSFLLMYVVESEYWTKVIFISLILYMMLTRRIGG